MAKPILTLAPYTAPDNLDLSSLTGSKGLYDYLDGDTGADYYKQQYSNQLIRKRFGGSRLTPVPFAEAAGTTVNFGNGQTRQFFATSADDVSYPWVSEFQHGLHTFSINGTGLGITPGGNVNFGLRWQIEADQHLREVVFIQDAYSFGGSRYQVTATIGDNSNLPVVIAMSPTSYGSFQPGDCTFKCVYRSRIRTTITIELRCIININDAYFVYGAGYLKYPIKPPTPKVYKQMLGSRNGVCRA